MTTTTTEGQQAATGQANQAAAGQQQQPGQAAPAAGQQAAAATQTGQQAAQQATQTGQQQAGQQGTDELTPEEEAALGDPGKRALQRVKEERNTLREQHTTTAAELEQVRGQLQQALATIAQGGDQAQQQALQTATTERDQAQLSLRQVTAVLRNGLAVQQPNETPAQLAQRVAQVAGLLQGTDDAALDNSARVLLSLTGGQQAAGQQQQQVQQVIPPGDANAAAVNSGGAGDMSMSDRIRAAAGRRGR